MPDNGLYTEYINNSSKVLMYWPFVANPINVIYDYNIASIVISLPL